MNLMNEIEPYIPKSPSDEIPWNEVHRLFSGTCFPEMGKTKQNPVFHGEGDVYTHTQMVCRELAKNTAFHRLPPRQKTQLFLAALLHDLGKVKTARLEDGVWTSPHHASTGSQIIREFLWRDWGLCGDPDLIADRETVCALVRYHMLPVRLMDQKNPERKVREVAAIGELASGFSWKMLCMLAEADVRGRISDDIETGAMQVQLSGLMAQESGCLNGPYPFSDLCAKHAYLSGRNVQPDQALYDNTWGEVIMLSGLPGTGKDTWIHENAPRLPVVSLDDIRTKLRIKPTDNQGLVIQTAREQAREYLRRKQPFIWNATNLTKDTRLKLAGLFERYGARVRIVYLETAWDKRVKRNCNRADAVPESVINKMIGKTLPPTPEEAQCVEWGCV